MATSVLTVTVKWRKQAFPDVTLDTALPADVFQSQLYTLTGVPPARQTILGLRGGKKITADADLSKLGIKDRQTLMLLGSPEADTPAAAPAKAGAGTTHVADDLDLDAPKEDAAALSAAVATPTIAVPPGLINMGNTCYMNSVVQVLNRVPELRAALGGYRGGAGEEVLNPSARLTASLRDLLSRLNVRGVAAINPSGFISALRTANPQFAERAGPVGMFTQQDAEECWGEILTRLSSTLPAPARAGDAAAAESESAAATASGDAPAAAANGSGAPAAGANAVDSLFGITTVAVDTCTEEGSTETVSRRETVRTLKCHIVQSVNHLADGLSAALSETIDMVSASLGRSARWARVSRLDTLPPYLAVQFVRFAWKPVERVRAKILRNVSFPLTLDVYDFCTDESRTRMTGARERARRAADEVATRAATDLEATNAAMEDVGDSATAAPAAADSAAAARTAGGATDRAASSSVPDADAGDSAMETSAPADINGSSAASSGSEEVTGVYELIAVLTHQGRAADGGHYVAWVKADPPTADASASTSSTGPTQRTGSSAASATPWIKLDDNKVSLTTAEEVLKLSGGGDWHTAYMLLYRAKRA
ncbi:hypothetical protein MMPV_005391 [Pyropia vietnamensis]